MRRGVVHRLSGIISGIAFALAVAGPLQWDSCPVHGDHAHGAMPMAAHAHGHSGGAAQAAHDPSSDQHGGHHCTCPDCCCATAALALLASPAAVPVPRLLLVVDRDIPRAVAELAIAPQVVLPYPHAPPSFRVQG
jgi:hypothetical protein